MSAPETPGVDRGLWLSVSIRAVPEVVVVAILSQYLAGESVPGYCDENVGLGTPYHDGCEFLANGGYTLIRVVPAAVVVGFTLLAARRRRVGLIHAGFALAIALLLLALALEPSEYPV